MYSREMIRMPCEDGIMVYLCQNTESGVAQEALGESIAF